MHKINLQVQEKGGATSFGGEQIHLASARLHGDFLKGGQEGCASQISW